MPRVKRNYLIPVQTADGKPMEGAGDKYTEEVILRIGTQCNGGPSDGRRYQEYH